MDGTAFRTKLAATAKLLEDVGRTAEPANPPALAAAAAELRRAAAGVDEMIRLLSNEPERSLRACPACDKSVMAAARLCGYCWTKLSPLA